MGRAAEKNMVSRGVWIVCLNVRRKFIYDCDEPIQQKNNQIKYAHDVRVADEQVTGKQVK